VVCFGALKPFPQGLRGNVVAAVVHCRLWQADSVFQRRGGIQRRLGRLGALPRNEQSALFSPWLCAPPRLTCLAVQDSPPVDVSVFKITGASASDPKLVAARNGVKRLRTVRGARLRTPKLRQLALEPARLCRKCRAESPRLARSFGTLTCSSSRTASRSTATNQAPSRSTWSPSPCSRCLPCCKSCGLTARNGARLACAQCWFDASRFLSNLLSDDYIALGLSQVAQAVAFLNADCKMVRQLQPHV